MDGMLLNRNVGLTASKLFEWAARGALSFLLVTVLLAITLAIIKTFSHILTQGSDIHGVLKTVMVNSLTVLALLEVFKTGLVYFSEGRVRVTYIIDTVIVVILTEVMIFWFKDIDYLRIILVIVLVLSLIVARILTINFSPAQKVKHKKEV